MFTHESRVMSHDLRTYLCWLLTSYLTCIRCSVLHCKCKVKVVDYETMRRLYVSMQYVRKGLVIISYIRLRNTSPYAGREEGKERREERGERREEIGHGLKCHSLICNSLICHGTAPDTIQTPSRHHPESRHHSTTPQYVHTFKCHP